ncbi:MAG: hypothetical protein D3913_14770, partial [Candidatus Electrothrix sp. LOE1_4_5]|nr:hypothetical protein [Candidatus Electrothrix gigas]
MEISTRAIQLSLHKPKLVTAIMVVLTLIIGAFIVKVHVDTDPENMLSEDEAVRVFHNQTKKEFGLYDVVVLGVVNEQNPDETTLGRILKTFKQKHINNQETLLHQIRTRMWRKALR